MMSQQPRHDLHQHDLQQAAAEAFVARAGVQPGELVFEAGPGLGAITAALLAVGAKVVAWEVDAQRLAGLRRRFATINDDASPATLSLFQGSAVNRLPDAVRAALQAGKKPPVWRVIANPPFNLTAELMQSWLLAPAPPQRIDCLWQHQAAAKWCATAPAATVSGLLAAAQGQAAIVQRLPRDITTPPSHVDLCHFSWQQSGKATGALSPEELFVWWRHLFSGFHSLAEALRGIATPAILKKQSSRHGYAPSDHPRVLSIDAWQDLLGYLQHIGRAPPSEQGRSKKKTTANKKYSPSPRAKTARRRKS